jgi:2-haloacid dehalogenase
MNEIKIISFDCLGTLVDWKEGILNNLRPLFKDYLIEMEDEEIFNLFCEFEKAIIAEEYVSYRCVLQNILNRFAALLNINFSNDDLHTLVRSLPNWPVFPDTLESLIRLSARYKLAIIANIDNDLIEKCLFLHEVKFDWVLTSEVLKSYKPSQSTFIQALNKFNISVSEVIHVAQSFYHDIIPTQQMGINNVWINRYPEIIQNDFQENPKLSFPDLRHFSDYVLKL